MRRSFVLSIIAALAITACTGGTVAGDPPDPTSDETTTTASTVPEDRQETAELPEQSYAGIEPAPPFPAGLDWLNTGRELTLEELKGKVVLLDFWTYGCINCIHIIPDLKRLEAEFDEELVVIGVHSAKFVNESATDNIRQIMLRYELEHPVVNDRDFEIWTMWGANAWPTTVLIDPAGNVVGGHAGEGVYDVVQPVIASLVQEFEALGVLDRTPIEFALEREGLPSTILSFPGKVFADGDRLFVADSNHHRIVQVESATGNVTAVFGNGRRGFVDGPALEAQFAQPQGLALSGDSSTLYVADTENHAIRAIDLSTGDVTTVTGTGSQAPWPPTGGLIPGTPISSPWDVTWLDDVIYVAMAGTHQIWAIDLRGGTTSPVVGNGRESTLNGPLATAELAQPSGLAFDDGGRLYFADSESSSIRWADVLDIGGTTGVLSGSDASLFDFGDVDGVGTAARLQHPLGVAFDPSSGDLFITDTYNSKVKRINPVTGDTTTFAGGDHGWRDGLEPLFYEPGGLSISGESMWIADTNNHAVRQVNLATGATSTLVLKGIERFTPPHDFRGTLVALESVQTASGEGSFRLDVTLPEGHKVNADAPSSVTWTADGTGTTLPVSTDLTGTTFPVTVPVTFTSGESLVTADTTIIWCAESAESLCFIEQVRFTIPVSAGSGSETVISIPYTIVLPVSG